MGQIKEPEAAMVFCAVFSSSKELIEKAKEELESRFGPVLKSAGTFQFDYTDYYEDEMGTDLLKDIFLFDSMINPIEIADIKIWTNEIEEKLSAGEERDVNLDPGYVTEAKMILATTKNYSHRIYIGKGIYCEITLTFHKGTFTVNPWTYRDYAEENIISFFNDARAEIKKRI